MRLWNRTTITWQMWGYDGGYGRDKGVCTRLPVSDAPQGITAYHVCSRIIAESQLTRDMHFTLTFNEGKHGMPLGDYKEIERRLGLMRYGTRKFHPTPGKLEGSKFTIDLPLQNGEHFCERAIEFVNELFSDWGIEDKQGRMRGNFDISQNTQVMQGGEWRSYKQFLQQKFGLQDAYQYYWTN